MNSNSRRKVHFFVVSVSLLIALLSGCGVANEGETTVIVGPKQFLPYTVYLENAFNEDSRRTVPLCEHPANVILPENLLDFLNRNCCPKYLQAVINDADSFLEGHFRGALRINDEEVMVYQIEVCEGQVERINYLFKVVIRNSGIDLK